MNTRVPFLQPHTYQAFFSLLLGVAAGFAGHPVSAHDESPAASGSGDQTSGSSGHSSSGGGGTPNDVMEEIKALREKANPDEPLDEALGGKTVQGTPVHPRTPAYFPSEQRDIFWQMDWVADLVTRKLGPIDFDQNADGKIDNNERDAIRGRNTWLLWGGGNEAFWGWLQERGYGISDFLILMNSKDRGIRFKRAGLINQPGFMSVSDDAKRILGLYIDQPSSNYSAYLRPRAWNESGAEIKDAQNRPLETPVGIPSLPHGGLNEPFEPGDRNLYEATVEKMPTDGLDYSVYGFPSGIFGLRLMFNPDFFGNTKAAEEARAYWEERVLKAPAGAYYTNPGINQDPRLVRPFRPSMSCGFCHIGPHPLIPPADAENPQWYELSSIIGSQYWKPQPAFANLATPDNFLYHFLNSQPPGTIDTSLVSTDQMNNTNVINAVFDIPARLARAETKPAEVLAGSNLLLLNKPETDPPVPVKCPMVLFPGEDSVGVPGALGRVPLNIGVFSELWALSDNPFIGFTPQRPFKIATCRTNSVYWMVNERYRVPYMAAFFTHGTPLPGGRKNVVMATDAMRLRDAGGEIDEKVKDVVVRKVAAEGQAATPEAPIFPADFGTTYAKGRHVFLNNCAICHSSKQPNGFHLVFQREMEDWKNAMPPQKAKESDPYPLTYTLPMTYDHWEDFRDSPAMKDYRNRIAAVAGEAPADWKKDKFIEDNFLSHELRIPVTLVGTNAARSLATNAMAGNVWNDYSSDTFKKLQSVGKIRYFNISAGLMPADPKFGTNAEFDDGRVSGGPGYMRPPSLISVWATAPYFHNNALGLYNHNPSVEGRLEAFDDGIKKLLNNAERAKYSPLTVKGDQDQGTNYANPGDLRAQGSPIAKGDPGYIYRIPQDTHFKFAAGFIPYLVKGVSGETVFRIISFWVWVILAVLLGAVAWKGRARHAGFLFLLVAVALGALLAWSGIAETGGSVHGAMTMAMATGMDWTGWHLWLFPVLLAALGFWLSFTKHELKKPVRWFYTILTVLVIGSGILANRFLNGRLKDRHPLIALLPNSWIDGDYKGLAVGPIPRGTPVDLLMNMDPEKKDKLPRAIAGLARAMITIKKKGLTGEAAWAVFEREAVPALLEASKCPDFVLDRGHWFGEELTKAQKEDLTAFLKTL